MIDYIDLLGLLLAYNKKLDNITLFGNIVSRLPRPVNLMTSCGYSPTGYFVKMEVFAVDLSYYKQYLKQCGYESSNDMYMVNGSVCLFIEPAGLILPDWYSVKGTLRVASKDTNDCLCLFNFRKSNNNWFIEPNILDDAEIGNWDKSSRMYSYLAQSYNTGRLIRPDDVSSLRLFKAKEDAPIKVNIQKNESLDDSLSKYVNNVEPPQVKNNNFRKESRSSIKEYSELAENLKGILNEAKTSRAILINTLKTQYSEEGVVTDYVRNLVEALDCYLKSKPSTYAFTGRAILTKYLKTFSKLYNANYLGTTAGKYLIDSFSEVKDFILEGETVLLEGAVWTLCKKAFYNLEYMYAVIVAQIIGVSVETLTEIQEVCESEDISFSKLINENPYALQLIGGLSYSTVEHIALCFNKHEDKSLDKYRNIAILNSYISEADSSTVYKLNTIRKATLGTKLSEAKYKQNKETGSCLSNAVKSNVIAYILRYTARLGYDTNMSKVGYYYIAKISNKYIDDIVNDYIESGLGVRFDDYITSTRLLEKELFVYETMYEIGHRTRDYDKSLIDTYINEYENFIGFKLEKEQRMAVHLVVNDGAIVAGSAGSGKTTITNCIVYVLDKLDGGCTPKFATPTGKAAKRMQEVVCAPVKTMNSMFKIYGVDNNILSKDEVDDSSYETYFFDEGAMVTIDLLYSILKKTGSLCRIYIFGDFHQLPPIGKGLPFKNLLRFMPCVFLNVSKRAVSGSNITLNSNIINNFSESNNWCDLKSEKDFFLAPCNEDDMQNIVVNICKHYIGDCTPEESKALCQKLGISELPTVEGLSKDDIQVVSPLSKATYKWGTTQLNKLLQPVFNKTRGYDKTFVYQASKDSPYRKFVLGDRVIHTESNMYNMQWYSSYEDGVFQKIYGHGICNGDVGKVVAFIPSAGCIFEKEIGVAPADFEYPDNLRDDSTFCSNTSWFVVVEYYDYMDSINYYILYRCDELTDSDVNIGKAFKGDDLAKLSLFYAGTCHKLQGSQAKIIISPLGNVNYQGFITRNMMYTVYTRGECLVFAIGSVGNDSNSMLSRARRDVADFGTLTIGELLYS